MISYILSLLYLCRTQRCPKKPGRYNNCSVTFGITTLSIMNSPVSRDASTFYISLRTLLLSPCTVFLNSQILIIISCTVQYKLYLHGVSLLDMHDNERKNVMFLDLTFRSLTHSTHYAQAPPSTCSLDSPPQSKCQNLDSTYCTRCRCLTK